MIKFPPHKDKSWYDNTKKARVISLFFEVLLLMQQKKRGK